MPVATGMADGSRWIRGLTLILGISVMRLITSVISHKVRGRLGGHCVGCSYLGPENRLQRGLMRGEGTGEGLESQWGPLDGKLHTLEGKSWHEETGFASSWHAVSQVHISCREPGTPGHSTLTSQTLAYHKHNSLRSSDTSEHAGEL